MVSATRDRVKARIYRLPFPPYSGPPIRRWLYEVSVEGEPGAVTGAHMTREDAQREVELLVHDPALLLSRLGAGRYMRQIDIDPSLRAVLKALFGARDDLRKLGNDAAADMVHDAIHRVVFPPSDARTC